MRIVSLLPSATEILHAVGAGSDVVGVTFECDSPAHARSAARVVSTSHLPSDLTPAEIDKAVRSRIAAGDDLYRLDRSALQELRADLVVTQDLCAVCAVDVSEVRDALDYLGCTADVLTTDPHTLAEVWSSVESIAGAVGQADEGLRLAADLRGRMKAVEAAVEGRTRPGCMVLEWSDPPYAPGHWVPEMVSIAGGRSVLGEAGVKSRPTSWRSITAAAPEVVVVAPCGFDLPTSTDIAKGGVVRRRHSTRSCSVGGRCKRLFRSPWAPARRRGRGVGPHLSPGPWCARSATRHPLALRSAREVRA